MAAYCLKAFTVICQNKNLHAQDSFRLTTRLWMRTAEPVCGSTAET